jgi:hypothetical protein
VGTRQPCPSLTAEESAAWANLFPLHDAFYINCTEVEKNEQVGLLIECMNQACEDVLGKQVKIPVEVNVYGAQDGYHDPRADKIDTMLKTVLNGAE